MCGVWGETRKRRHDMAATMLPKATRVPLKAKHIDPTVSSHWTDTMDNCLGDDHYLHDRA